MSEDREMTPADFQAVTQDCVRRTVNFHGAVPMNKSLGFFQIDSDSEIELLKDLLTGKNNPEIGVTHFLYRLDRGFLNGIDADTTVLAVSDILKTSSVPDMTNRRALLVIVGSAAKVTGHTFPQSDPGHPLKEIGIDAENVDEFKKTVVENPVWGVPRFRRKLDPDQLGSVTPDSKIGDVMDVLREHSEPDIKNGDPNA